MSLNDRFTQFFSDLDDDLDYDFISLDDDLFPQDEEEDTELRKSFVFRNPFKGWDGSIANTLENKLSVFGFIMFTQGFGLARIIGMGGAVSLLLTLSVISSMMILSIAGSRILCGNFLFSVQSIFAVLISIVLPLAYILFPNVPVFKLLYAGISIGVGFLPTIVVIILIRLRVYHFGVLLVAALLINTTEGIMIGNYFKRPS